MQLIEGATKEQVAEAIRMMKFGGLLINFSSYTAMALEPLGVVVELDDADKSGEGAPKKILHFLSDQLEKM